MKLMSAEKIKKFIVITSINPLNEVLRKFASIPQWKLILIGDRKGQYAIRINQKWRLCFEWRDGNAYNVEIADYH